jgi:hypothetical protein
VARFIVAGGYAKNERTCTLMAKFHGLHRPYLYQKSLTETH